MHFGHHSIKGVDFWFAFDGESLTLIPVDEANKELAFGLTHKKLGEGAYAWPGEEIETNCPLVLQTNIQGEVLILFPSSVSYAVDDRHNGILSLQIRCWFSADPSSKFSGISITSDILDNAYDIQNAVDSSSFDPDGKIEITSSRKEGHSFSFSFRDAEVEGYLSHARDVSFDRGELPIKLRSQLSLTFPETSDYIFIHDLAMTMHDYLAFIAQGYGYQFDDIKLLKQYGLEGVSYLGKCGEYFENRRDRNGASPRRLISLKGCDELSECIFQSLANGLLPIEHLPSLDEKNSYNVARLIMMLAALDKTMEALYQNGVAHSEKTLESRNAINCALDSLIGANTPAGLKREVKRLKRILNESESLQSRISQFGKDHKELFDSLKGDVYKSYQKRTAFFRRITNTRNKIAHGDFDVFKDLSFDDIEGINRLLLSSQLVLIGIEEERTVAEIVNEAC